jgi:hypothetical protein
MVGEPGQPVKKENKMRGSLSFGPKFGQTQIKTKALVQNFLICGQLEAHLGSPQGEVDVAI